MTDDLDLSPAARWFAAQIMAAPSDETIEETVERLRDETTRALDGVLAERDAIRARLAELRAGKDHDDA
jgi:hypothetical protein